MPLPMETVEMTRSASGVGAKLETMMATQARACSSSVACTQRAAALMFRPMMSGSDADTMNRLMAVVASRVRKSSCMALDYWKATSAKLRSLRLCRRCTPPLRRISMARMPMRRCWSTRSR